MREEKVEELRNGGKPRRSGSSGLLDLTERTSEEGGGGGGQFSSHSLALVAEATRDGKKWK